MFFCSIAPFGVTFHFFKSIFLKLDDCLDLFLLHFDHKLQWDLDLEEAKLFIF
jgi:hypothetical protein